MELTTFTTQEIWRDNPERRPYLLVLYWAPFEGRPEVHGIELRSVPRPADWGDEPYESELNSDESDVEPFPISTSVLRDVKLREVANRHRDMARFMVGLWPAVDPKEREDRKRLLASLERTKHRGRRGYGPRHYEQVAEIWDRARREGKRAPTGEVARWLGGQPSEHVKGGWDNYSVAQKHVARARKLGFIKEDGR